MFVKILLGTVAAVVLLILLLLTVSALCCQVGDELKKTPGRTSPATPTAASGSWRNT